MKNPRVSIIIVTFNSEKDIKKCLEAVFQQNYLNYEVIVLDNNSEDQSLEIIKKNFPKVKIMESKKNTGFAQGNNLAAKNASGDFLALLNPDTVVDKNWLLELIQVFQKDPKAAICQPKIKIFGKNQINTAGSKVHFLGFGWSGNCFKPDKGFEKEKEIFAASGCAMLVKKSVWQKLGGFDPDFFMYLEDTDFSWRARLLGYKILFVPKAVVFHKYHFSKGKYKYYYLEKNRLSMIWKNYSLLFLILISPLILFSELGLIFYFLITEKGEPKIESYAGFIKEFPKLLQKRKKIQHLRKIHDSEILFFMESSRKFLQETKNLISS